jgi:hypothetical protein
MATRVRGNATIDPLKVAQEYRDRINTAILSHIPHCPKCSRARGDVYRTCDVGWQLAKRQHAAIRAVERAEEHAASHPEQDTLW